MQFWYSEYTFLSVGKDTLKSRTCCVILWVLSLFWPPALMFFQATTWAMKKNRLFRVCRAYFGGYNKPLWGSLLNNEYFMESKAGFFSSKLPQRINPPRWILRSNDIVAKTISGILREAHGVFLLIKKTVGVGRRRDVLGQSQHATTNWWGGLGARSRVIAPMTFLFLIWSKCGILKCALSGSSMWLLFSKWWKSKHPRSWQDYIQCHR